jgi:hypothetical protein
MAALDLADTWAVTRTARVALLGLAVASSALTIGAATTDPIALLTLSGADSTERSRVAAGGAVLTIVPSRGRDLAVFGVATTTANGSRLAAWTRMVDLLYAGRFTSAIRRFSDPPHLDDVAGLTLDEQDLNDLRNCRPGDCAVKVSASEMERIRQAADAGGPAWRTAVQHAFRQVVLARAVGYLESGLAGSPAYDDRKTAVSPLSEFEELAARLGFEPLYGARVLPYLRAFPDGDRENVESFLYWSKETLGSGKPIVSVTHVAIFSGGAPGGAGVVIAARQVFATHYLTGSLSITSITGAVDGAPAYLVYIRRSRTDAFEGAFGKFVRHIVERRIRSDGPAVLDALRRKLEQGDPADVNSTR